MNYLLPLTKKVLTVIYRSPCRDCWKADKRTVQFAIAICHGLNSDQSAPIDFFSHLSTHHPQLRTASH